MSFDVANLTEARFDDSDGSFTSSSDAMNGMTLASASDSSRGIVFEWNGVDRSLAFELVPALHDLRARGALQFRACQATRNALTTAVLGDLSFTVGLRDAHGVSSTIALGTLGYGLEEPYQRLNCGLGAGWGNEFETVHIPLEDFARTGVAFDLSDVAAVEFWFGPSFGASGGRIGFDDLMVTPR